MMLMYMTRREFATAVAQNGAIREIKSALDFSETPERRQMLSWLAA
jgi:hypothetical protein